MSWAGTSSKQVHEIRLVAPKRMLRAVSMMSEATELPVGSEPAPRP